MSVYVGALREGLLSGGIVPLFFATTIRARGIDQSEKEVDRNTTGNIYFKREERGFRRPPGFHAAGIPQVFFSPAGSQRKKKKTKIQYNKNKIK